MYKETSFSVTIFNNDHSLFNIIKLQQYYSYYINVYRPTNLDDFDSGVEIYLLLDTF
jgi:hypothetical protein